VKARAVWRGLCVAVSVLAGILVAAPASVAATDTARLAAEGIDSSELAPGWSIVGDEIWWDDGEVRRSLGDAELAPCPTGYLCLYADADLLGDRWVTSRTNVYHYLAPYGWHNRVSSWVNRTATDARWWYYESGSPNPYRCMNPGTGEEHMSAADNDQMSTVHLYTSAAIC
jgi:hypothetical protein